MYLVFGAVTLFKSIGNVRQAYAVLTLNGDVQNTNSHLLYHTYNV